MKNDSSIRKITIYSVGFAYRFYLINVNIGGSGHISSHVMDEIVGV